MDEPDPVRMQIYGYVRDQHDKILNIRQGQKARLGSFLVLIGLLVTAVFTFGVPTMLTTIKQIVALEAAGQYLWSAALLPILPFSLALVFLAMSLWATIGLLSRIIVMHPGLDRKRILSALDYPPKINKAIRGLTVNYLNAIRENEKDNRETADQFGKIIVSVERSAIFVSVFLLVTVVVTGMVTIFIPTQASTSRTSLKGTP
jgi:hypothetical protein